MGSIHRVEDCVAWQAARELSREIYKETTSGAFSRDYGLKDQIRRSAVSVVSNTAEGFERGSNKILSGFFTRRRVHAWN